MKNTIVAAGLVAALVITGCTSMSTHRDPSAEFRKDYGKVVDNGFRLPAIPVRKIDKKFLRQIVDYQTRERPGTVVVSVKERFLYLVQPDGKAVRYGIGVGKQGFAWAGSAYVGWKAEWPTWTPPAPMLKRKPELKKYAGGMPPGLGNPLGARAMYLMRNGQDTMYRLHGTPEWWTIGTAASSGCIRLMNQDIIDLHSRIKSGAKVVVRQS